MIKGVVCRFPYSDEVRKNSDSGMRKEKQNASKMLHNAED